MYGSADVVGLMCLKVFVKGDKKNIITKTIMQWL
jgi:phytoene/squalene synthetase